MKKILCTILTICVMASSFPAFQFHARAAEDTRYIVYEQDMEDQELGDILVSIKKPATAAGYALEDDTFDPGNKVLALTGSGGRFEVQPQQVCTGTETTLEYRFKFREGTKANNFELMRAFADSSTSLHMIYNGYTGAFTYRADGVAGAPSTGKKATPGTWYRYVVTLKNLPSENAKDKVFDHFIYEQQADGSEKLIFSIENLPVMQQSNPDRVGLLKQFHRFWIDTMNVDNLLFDDIRVYSNNKADVSEEYILRSDRSFLVNEDLTDEPSDQITANLKLPDTAQLGSSITWTSSNPDIIDPTTGVVTRQVDTADVTLTAQLSRDSVDKVFTKDFAFTVLADDRPDQEVVDDRASKLDLEGKDHIMFDFPLPDTAGYRTNVTWSVDPNPVIEINGYGAMVTRPEQDTEVTLHAVVSRNDATAAQDVVVKVLNKGAEKDICNPYEDFGQYSDDATELKNWTLNKGDGVIEKVTTDGVSALKLSKPPGSAPTNAVLDFSEQADNATFVARMRATGLNADSKVLSLSQADGEAIYFMNADGRLVANVYNNEADLGEFPEGQWFTLKVDINHDERLINIYVNGERRTDGISVSGQVPAISKASAELSANAAGEIYIDYIKGFIDFYRDIDLTIDQIDFSNIDTNNITSNFSIPAGGVNKTRITWLTSNPSVINVVGDVAQVTRPAADAGDAEVTLTAVVSNSFASKGVSFDFKVLRNLSDQEIVELDLAKIELPEAVYTNVTKRINLPETGGNGCVMKWESSNAKVIGTDGKIYSFGYDGNAVENVKLTVTISYGNAARTKVFDVAVHRINFAVDTYATASSNEPGFPASNAVDHDPDTYWLAKANEARPSLEITLGDATTLNQILLRAYGNSAIETKIEYSANEIDWYPLCVVSHISEQPKLIEFDEITAKYLRYTVTEKTLEAAGLYELELYYDENPGKLLEKAVQAVSISNANNIKEDFTLPLTGLYHVTFEWKSDDESIIKIDNSNGKAAVTRPETDTTVNLNLKASLSGETITATKPVTVKGTRSSGGGGGSSGTGGGTKGNKGNGGSAGIINLPGGTPQAPPQKLYDDVEDTHWAKRYIENVSANGIMTGRSDHLFDPDANITREEFVKVLMLGFGFELTDAVDEEFADVEKNAWSYPYVASAKKLGIVNGINENEFGASFNITREDMAVMVVRAAEQKGINYSAVSNDITIADQDEISDYAKQSVKILTEASILSGVGENMFAPKQPATRAEVAKIICLLDK